MVATISLALEVKLSNWNEGWHSVYRGRLKGFARGTTGYTKPGTGTAWLAGVVVFASVAGPKSDAGAC